MKIWMMALALTQQPSTTYKRVPNNSTSPLAITNVTKSKAVTMVVSMEEVVVKVGTTTTTAKVVDITAAVADNNALVGMEVVTTSSARKTYYKTPTYQ